MRNSSFAVGTVLVLLIGCGGSGGENVGGGGVVVRQSYDELVSEFEMIDANFDRGNIDQISDPTALPTTGGVTYHGVLGANLPDGEAETTSVIGDMTMTVNFQNDDISGSVINFIDQDSVAYNGMLLITNGVIDRRPLSSTYVFSADIDGTLSAPSVGISTVDATLGGDFYGANETYVGGGLNGTITTPSDTVTLDGNNSYFVGERQ